MASKNGITYKIVVKKQRNDLKIETAREVGIPLVKGYYGNLASRQNSSVCGHMIKSMMEIYERNLIGK